MPVRQVVRLPATSLRAPSRVIEEITDEVRSLADDLVDTMRISPGCVGLAAPQIGVDLRAFALDVTGHPKARSCVGLVVMLNPVIVAATNPVVGREGCMSVPDLTGDVPRATQVTVRGIDADGQELVIDADAFEARAILHEVDHLDGYLFLDRVTSRSGVFPRKVYR